MNTKRIDTLYTASSLANDAAFLLSGAANELEDNPGADLLEIEKALETAIHMLQKALLEARKECNELLDERLTLSWLEEEWK